MATSDVWRRRALSPRTTRLLAAAVACSAFGLTLYLAFVSGQRGSYHWGLQVAANGTILKVDPSAHATDLGVVPGDRVVTATDSHGAALPRTAADTAAVVRVQHGPATTLVLEAPRQPYAQQPIAVILALLACFFLLCGLVVWMRAITRAAALHMFALCTVIALMLVGTVGATETERISMRLIALCSGVYFPILFASFFLTFPRNRLRGHRGRRVGQLLSAVGGGLTVLYALAIAWLPPLYPLVYLAFLLMFLASLITALASLLHGYRAGTERVRQQRRIIVGGTVGGFAPFLLLSVVPAALTGGPLVSYGESVLPLALLPLSFGYAIMKYDLLRVDTMVRRAAVHSLFIASLLCIYMGVIYSGGQVLARILTSGPRGAPLSGLAASVPALAAALAVGLLMAPLRAIVQSTVERLLFPEFYRYNQLVRDGWLPNEGRDLGVLADLLNTSVRALLPVGGVLLFVRGEGHCYTLCPRDARDERAGLWPRSPAGPAMLESGALTGLLAGARWGCGREDLTPERGLDGKCAALLNVQGAALLVPLRQNNIVIGFLAIGPRSDDQPFSGADRELLALVAERYALAVDHAVLLGTLERRVRDISSLYEASAALTAALRSSPDEVPHHVSRAAASIAGVTGVRLVMTQAEQMAPRNGHGGPGGGGKDGHSRPPTVWRDAWFAPGVPPMAHLPLHAGDRTLGMLHLELVGPVLPGPEERRLLVTFANQAAVALEHAQLYGQAVRHAEREPLTGLYNHRMIAGFLQRELLHAQQAGQPLSVLMMDVRNFKLFNDTYGHLAGDQLLKRVAEVLDACSRQTDFAGRTGGDEFTVLLPGADHTQARAIAERIHAMAADNPHETADGRQIPLDLNIGVAAYPDDGDAVNALLMAADERMYAAKRSGSAVQGLPRDDDNPVSAGRFGVLESLVAAVDNKDSYTAIHSDQVARFAILLAAELGASQETLRTLRVAGLLHDVGKIGVPDRILRKPGRLTDEEQEIMQQHVQLSEMLLRTVIPSPDLLDAVRYHHERWDGLGYPYGIAGEAIPLLGRVMIVADAVSAMIMDRPYRKGLAWETVCSELRRGAGTQFDPDLVEPFIRAATASGAMLGDPTAAGVPMAAPA